MSDLLRACVDPNCAHLNDHDAVVCSECGTPLVVRALGDPLEGPPPETPEERAARVERETAEFEAHPWHASKRPGGPGRGRKPRTSSRSGRVGGDRRLIRNPRRSPRPGYRSAR
jgi:hypothetical protein